MATATILLTASRFGGQYFLDIYGKMRPDDLILGELSALTDEDCAKIAQVLETSVTEVQKLSGQDPAQLWREIVAAAARHRRSCIARVHYYTFPQAAATWKVLAEAGRVIHLVRHNLFESYLSREVAQQAGRWQVRRGVGAPGLTGKKVTLDPNAARKHIEARSRDIAWARAQFRDSDLHEIAFEDINRAPGACAAAIRDIYADSGAPMPHPGAIRSELTRMRQRSNADIVENYLDVVHLDRNWT